MIDIFGGLKVVRPRGRFGGPGAKMVMEWKAPDVVFNGDDDRKVTGAMAEALAEAMRDALIHGALGPVPDASTMERRVYRVDQAGRGGLPSDHHTNAVSNRTGQRPSQVRQRAVANWFKRFKASRLGLFEPIGSRLFGVESGMLAASIVAQPQPDGSFRVFFAGVRAKMDRTGESAVLRVFKRLPGFVDFCAKMPQVQNALQRLKEDLLTSRAKALFLQAVETAKRAEQLSSTLEDVEQEAIQG